MLSTSADDADSELEEEDVVGVRIAGCEFMSGFILGQRYGLRAENQTTTVTDPPSAGAVMMERLPPST